jgi:hypothetical protein
MKFKKPWHIYIQKQPYTIIRSVYRRPYTNFIWSKILLSLSGDGVHTVRHGIRLKYLHHFIRVQADIVHQVKAR